MDKLRQKYTDLLCALLLGMLMGWAFSDPEITPPEPVPCVPVEKPKGLPGAPVPPKWDLSKAEPMSAGELTAWWALWEQCEGEHCID